MCLTARVEIVRRLFFVCLFLQRPRIVPNEELHFLFFVSRFFFVLTAYISRLYLIKRGEVGNLICGREHTNFLFYFIFCFSRATWLLNQKHSLFFVFVRALSLSSFTLCIKYRTTSQLANQWRFCSILCLNFFFVFKSLLFFVCVIASPLGGGILQLKTCETP